MVLAVEGMDGVGKTAIAKYISEKYGYTFIEKPLHYFYNDDKENNYDDLMRASRRMYTINDSVIKSWFFGLGNIFATRMFGDNNIVIDRHLVSNYYWNGNVESEPIFDALVQMGCVPDMTFLLYASVETRMNRIRNRNANDHDLTDPDMYDDGLDKMLYFIKKYNIPYVLIDTDKMDLDEVKSVIDSEMEKLKTMSRKLVNKINDENLV